MWEHTTPKSIICIYFDHVLYWIVWFVASSCYFQVLITFNQFDIRQQATVLYVGDVYDKAACDMQPGISHNQLLMVGYTQTVPVL